MQFYSWIRLLFWTMNHLVTNMYAWFEIITFIRQFHHIFPNSSIFSERRLYLSPINARNSDCSEEVSFSENSLNWWLVLALFSSGGDPEARFIGTSDCMGALESLLGLPPQIKKGATSLTKVARRAPPITIPVSSHFFWTNDDHVRHKNSHGPPISDKKIAPTILANFGKSRAQPLKCPTLQDCIRCDYISDYGTTCWTGCFAVAQGTLNTTQPTTTGTIIWP